VGDAVKVFLLTFSALFPIVDPLAGSPIFLAMTQDYSTGTRRSLAWRVALNSLVLMVASYFVGAHVLNFFGVSLPVAQVGGELGITEITVKAHRGQVMQKMKANSLADLVRMAAKLHSSRQAIHLA